MGDKIDKLLNSILDALMKFFSLIVDFVFSSKITVFLTWMVISNALGFLLMHHDKKLALYNGKVKEENSSLSEEELKKTKLLKRRIPERTLMLTALVGGSLGVLGGMYKFRHKTQKPLFKYGVPIIIALQIAFVLGAIINGFAAN